MARYVDKHKIIKCNYITIPSLQYYLSTQTLMLAQGWVIKTNRKLFTMDSQYEAEKYQWMLNEKNTTVSEKPRTLFTFGIHKGHPDRKAMGCIFWLYFTNGEMETSGWPPWCSLETLKQASTFPVKTMTVPRMTFPFLIKWPWDIESLLHMSPPAIQVLPLWQHLSFFSYTS